MIPTRDQALAWLKQYNQSEALVRHAFQVEAVMRYLARQAGEDEELWGVVGLLHDLDYEQYPTQHCVKTKEILTAKGADEVLIRAVISHGYGLCNDVEPQSQMEKYLYAIDELTGLIWATALMRPSKSVADMEVKSVKKKFKDKAFAAKVDREVIRQGAARLGLELEELMRLTLEGMKTLKP
jgi:putative nucleotidyltransferase with HDIG domain